MTTVGTAPTNDDTDDNATDEGRPRVRPRHVVALGISTLVLAGALVFAVLATSDRNDAADARHTAEHALAQQQKVTRKAATVLESRRTEASAALGPLGALATSAQGLVSLGDQALDEARTLQTLGANASASVDDYNASIDRANGIAAQYNAAVTAFVQQLGGSVPQPSTGQAA